MENQTIIRAWITLIALSLVSTAMALLISNDSYVTLGAVLVMFVAWLKARIILSEYLELNYTAFWRRGFNAGLTLFMVAAFGLYLVPILLN